MNAPDMPGGTAVRKPLRLWPGVALATLVALGWYVVPILAPDLIVYSFFAGLGGAAAIVLWWLLFSRASWVERLGAVALMAAAIAVTRPFVDVSIRTAAMGRLFVLMAIPPLSLAFVAWAVATRRLADRWRRAALLATVALACGAWTLVKTGGFTASMKNDYMWR